MTTLLEEPESKELVKLPELSIQIIGEVKGSNLVEYKKSALDFIESISTDLKTDDDFINATKTIKFCDNAEKELQKVKTKALSETADIEELFRTVDELTLSLKTKRLALNKISETRKAEVRTEIVDDATKRLDEYLKPVYEDIKPITLPDLGVDFTKAIKGKKTVKSCKEAVNAELKAAKEKTEEFQKHIKFNLTTLNEFAGEHKFLFNDLQQIIFKEFDHFELLVSTRVSEYKIEEQKKVDDKAEADALEEAKAEEEAKPEPVVEETKTEEIKPIFGGGCIGFNIVQTETITPNQEQPKSDDKEHRELFNNEAEQGYVKFGLSPAIAKVVVRATATGKIPHITINY